jgi:F0F1-type ATP synthase membrane subunit c/vacuolar-type H+-ATPase subunit K
MIAIIFIGLCIALSSAALGLSYCFSSGMSAISRNPSKSAELQTLIYVGAAFIELTALIAVGILFYLQNKNIT